MNEETSTVQHDGERNFLGGRNLIRNSGSPVMDIEEHQALPTADAAVADVTILAE